MEQHSAWDWKRAGDAEVDLADLLHKLCGKWKQAAACVLVFAILAGGYGWIKGSSSPQEGELGIAETAELTEAEERGIVEAVQLAQEIDGLETYLEHSVLMQIDAYRKERALLLFSIDRANRESVAKVTESYLSYINNGGAVEALKETGGSVWKPGSAYLAELVSAYQKVYSSPYQVVVEGTSENSVLSESLFYVEIIGSSAGTVKQMAQDMQDLLLDYAKEVKDTAGKHSLALVNSVIGVTADSGLQTQQHDKKSLLLSNQASLQALLDSFSEAQMAVYEDSLGTQQKKGEQEEEHTKGEEDGQNYRRIVKYMILGLFGGAFIYCSIFAGWYLFCGKVKSVEEIKRMYTFPVFGGLPVEGVPEKGGKGGSRKAADRGQGTTACAQAQVLNRIRLACKKQGVDKLCAASDFPLGRQEKGCLEGMAGQLQAWGIDLKVVENATLDPAVWDQLAETGNVIPVCKIGTTTYQMVDHAMGFYQENGVAVVGAVAFL